MARSDEAKRGTYWRKPQRGEAVKRLPCLGILVILGLSTLDAGAVFHRERELASVNRGLSGTIVDYTSNHGKDNRIYSRALGQKRDLYVYLPPKYNPECAYPIVLFLHGFGQDEQLFLKVAPKIDEAICKGKLPPMIVAAPDGSLCGEPSCFQPGSFFLNSDAGDFETWVLGDVWEFVGQHYPIRAEREAHVLAGVSMGGFAAYNFGFRHRDNFGVVAAFH